MNNRINVLIIFACFLFVLTPLVTLSLTEISHQNRMARRERESKIIGLKQKSITLFTDANEDFLEIKDYSEKNSPIKKFTKNYKENEYGLFINLGENISVEDIATLVRMMNDSWEYEYKFWYKNKDLSDYESIRVKFLVNVEGLEVNHSYSPEDSLKKIIVFLDEHKDELAQKKLYLSFNYMDIRKDTIGSSFIIGKTEKGYKSIKIKGERIITAIKISEEPQRIVEEFLDK